MSDFSYTPPDVRITATFAATDGTLPESMEIEFRDAPGIAALLDAVAALASVPHSRRAHLGAEPARWPALATPPSVKGADQ